MNQKPECFSMDLDAWRLTDSAVIFLGQARLNSGQIMTCFMTCNLQYIAGNPLLLFVLYNQSQKLKFIDTQGLLSGPFNPSTSPGCVSEYHMLYHSFQHSFQKFEGLVHHSISLIIINRHRLIHTILPHLKISYSSWGCHVDHGEE